MTASFLITALATLFVVIDPPGLVPLFIALTQGKDAEARRAMALRACIIAAVLLALFALAGTSILEFIGISMPAFRVAGGLLLFVTAFGMLFDQIPGPRDGQIADPNHDPSVFPLATPLIAGPGAIASMILLTEQAGGTFLGRIVVIVLMGLMVAATFYFLLASPAIERLVGRTGVLVVTKLLGMLLAALAVQFVIDGIHSSGLL
jgi:multiple antibiotic resistance protein